MIVSIKFITVSAESFCLQRVNNIKMLQKKITLIRQVYLYICK